MQCICKKKKTEKDIYIPHLSKKNRIENTIKQQEVKKIEKDMSTCKQILEILNY